MSKRCNEAAEKVYYYLDHEQLNWMQRTRIRYHLRRCAKCSDCYEFETHVQTVVRSKCQEDPPAELIHRLRAFIREHGSDEAEA